MFSELERGASGAPFSVPEGHSSKKHGLNSVKDRGRSGFVGSGIKSHLSHFWDQRIAFQ